MISDKLLARLRKNASRTKDPVIKALLDDLLKEVYVLDQHAPAEPAPIEPLAGQVLKEAQEAAAEAAKQIEAEEAAVYDAVVALKNTPKGRLPEFVLLITKDNDEFVAIKDRDYTHIFRSAECITTQARRTSATANAISSSEASPQSDT